MNFKRLTIEKQKESFDNLSPQFNKIVASIKNDNKKTWIKKEWKENVSKLSVEFKNGLPNNFLNIGSIRQSMFMDDQGSLMQHQLQLIEEVFKENKEFIKKVLEESPLGSPPQALVQDYNTSHNSIHHLYHIARYIRSIKNNLTGIKSVIEWGGGYGNFCKVLLFLLENVETYTVVDLEEMIGVQFIYLSSIFGEEKVNLISLENCKIKSGCINLVPLQFVDKVSEDFELFVSTWALSECPIEMHNFVKEDKHWFGAQNFLVSFHQCGDHIPFMYESTHLAMLFKKEGLIFQNVQVIPGKNYYAFR